MSVLNHQVNEWKAAEAFSKQSAVFDKIYGNDLIIAYKRERVRTHMLPFLPSGGSLLELNCGSGEDALYFAAKGFQVHATDIASGMLEAMQEKLDAADQSLPITTELCSFTALETLKNKGPYDAVYSNFGGLNCTGELDKVLRSLIPLTKPGGTVTLVIISPFCFWETMLVFKGRFRTAFRRFFSKNGRKACVEGSYFRCWYYPASFVVKNLEPEFELLQMEGLCSLVPPSYIEGFGSKYPRLFAFLRRREDQWKSSWPWKSMGDYYIITLRKKA